MPCGNCLLGMLDKAHAHTGATNRRVDLSQTVIFPDVEPRWRRNYRTDARVAWGLFGQPRSLLPDFDEKIERTCRGKQPAASFFRRNS